MAKLFKHSNEIFDEDADIEESHGIAIMTHEMKMKQELKGFRDLEFHLVEKRTKNKCPCDSPYYFTGRAEPTPKCPKPCRIRIHTTERIILVSEGQSKCPKVI